MRSVSFMYYRYISIFILTRTYLFLPSEISFVRTFVWENKTNVWQGMYKQTVRGEDGIRFIPHNMVETIFFLVL